MVPTLMPGDVVALDAAPSTPELPALGQIVVVRDPERPGCTLIKRVRSVAAASFAVGSDAPVEARDSRHFGSLDPAALVGVAVWIWSAKSGKRPLAPCR